MAVNNKLTWQFYPRSHQIPDDLKGVIKVFEERYDSIKSPERSLTSDQVLSALRNDLTKIGFQVERNKKVSGKVRVPVLFGEDGKSEKSFDADAFNLDTGVVLEVEAGRGVTNNQFLKDLFQACMMYNVKYLVIAIRNIYKGNRDFKYICNFFETLYTSGRLQLPLEGLLTIGY